MRIDLNDNGGRPIEYSVHLCDDISDVLVMGNERSMIISNGNSVAMYCLH